MRVRLSEQAEADLVSIGQWIARDNEHRAASFVNELLDACDGLVDFPEAYTRLDRFRERNVRSKVFEGYRIIHEVLASEVLVLSFLHGARDFDALDV